MKIEELNLSARAYNALKRIGFDTVEQVLEAADLMKYKSIGKAILTEIKQKVREAGYGWQKADCET